MLPKRTQRGRLQGDGGPTLKSPSGPRGRVIIKLGFHCPRPETKGPDGVPEPFPTLAAALGTPRAGLAPEV